ncbi:site-specific integrase [Saliphagus sp. GCM10025317]
MAPNHRDAPDLDIREATELFITRQRPNWKGETARSYRKGLDSFEDFAADHDLETLDDLDLWEVGKYTDWLVQTDYARATIYSKQKMARTWLKWLESQGLVDVGTHLAIETLRLEDS